MRTDPENPNGIGDPSIPCLQVPNLIGSPDGNPIVFPGTFRTSASSPAFERVGRRIRFRAELVLRWRRESKPSNGARALPPCVITMFSPHLKAELGAFTDPQNMINGVFDGTYLLAIDPKGRVPGEVYDPAVDGPLTAPNFGRHYRYNEVSLYGEDSIRLTNRFTLTLGMRWEYFGVLHSPNAERALDANFYFDATGSPTAARSFEDHLRASTRRTIPTHEQLLQPRLEQFWTAYRSCLGRVR